MKQDRVSRVIIASRCESCFAHTFMINARFPLLILTKEIIGIIKKRGYILRNFNFSIHFFGKITTKSNEHTHINV